MKIAKLCCTSARLYICRTATLMVSLYYSSSLGKHQFRSNFLKTVVNRISAIQSSLTLWSSMIMTMEVLTDCSAIADVKNNSKYNLIYNIKHLCSKS